MYQIPQQHYGQASENPQIDPNQPAIPYDQNMSISGGTSGVVNGGAQTAGSPRSLAAGTSTYVG